MASTLQKLMIPIFGYCTLSIPLNYNFYLWNGVLLFQQPLHNHHARLLQLCKVANTLHKLPQLCDNLVTILQSCSKVATIIGVARGGHGREFTLPSCNFALPSKTSYLNGTQSTRSSFITYLRFVVLVRRWLANGL